jgi:gliding-associated putative ABC transporter substrate-binding component GldG
LSFAQTQRARALINPYFSVADVELADSLNALDEFDGLIIARPKRAFSDKDLYLIDQFVMRGGRLMCFIDRLELQEDTLRKYGQTHTTRIETGLDKMLFDYGLKLEDNYVMDVSCLPKPVSLERQALIPWFFHVMATPTSHPIARNVEPVALKYASEIKLVQREGRVVQPILTSSSNSTATGMAPQVSYMIPMNYGKNPKLAPNPEDPDNAKCLAALAEGSFDSRFKNRLPPEFVNNKEINYLEKSTQEGKVFLVGNGRFIENRYDSMPSRTGNSYMYRPKQDLNDLQYDIELAQIRQPHIFGNQEFFQNLVDYMMGDNSVLDIRSREIEIHKIDNEKVKEYATTYKIVNVGLPVVLILILGFLLYFIRKQRFAS